MTKSSAMWGLLSIAIVAASAPVKSESPCQPIRFKAGSYSATIRGVAPAKGMVCYSFATGSGQAAEVSIRGTTVLKGLAFNISDVAENQDRVRFTTKNNTYRISVYVFPRSATGIPFALKVSVRGRATSSTEALIAASVHRGKVAQYVGDFGRGTGIKNAKLPKFTLKLVDLNGDGVSEALVVITDYQYCGSRGCSAFVLDLRGARARSLGDYIAHRIDALPSTTNGWRDILLNGRYRNTFKNGKYRR